MSLEENVNQFGSRIFAQIDREQPSAFNTKFWSGMMLEWSMKHPELKANLFRLVDVLPTLKSSRAVMEHVQEYLGEEAKRIHSLAAWGVDVPPSSLRAKAAASLIRQGVRQMARQFIAGVNPKDALAELKRLRASGIAFTVDLLGEYCVSEQEADAYEARYRDAIETLGAAVPKWKGASPILPGHPGEESPVCLSVKLSALYSQASSLNFHNSVTALTERLTTLARLARDHGAQLYVDAEDTDHNEVIYEVFQRVFGSNEFKDFPYPGIVLQAYCRRSEEQLEELLHFAKERGPIAVRLVKGAYWDAETVMSSQQNWESPLFSEKESSDAQFERLTDMLLENIEHCLPAFGSHNIRSLSYACCRAEELGIEKSQYELQMLYGMAEPIARAFQKEGYLVRLYVPLGELIPGMGYLVRRLLENTSNESFLKHTFFDQNEIEKLLKKPALKS